MSHRSRPQSNSKWKEWLSPASLLIALLAAQTSWAQEGEPSIIDSPFSPDRAYISMASKHAGIDPKDFGKDSWNEFNPGLILSWEDRLWSLDFALGGFKNSFGDFSAYTSIAKFWSVTSNTSVGTVLSFAHYGENRRYFKTQIGSTDFVAIPALQLNHKNVFIQVQPNPRKNERFGAVIGVGITFSLTHLF